MFIGTSSVISQSVVIGQMPRNKKAKTACATPSEDSNSETAARRFLDANASKMTDDGQHPVFTQHFLDYESTSSSSPPYPNSRCVCVCVNIYVYIYMYMYSMSPRNENRHF